jgi:thymidylate synthase (FAD)
MRIVEPTYEIVSMPDPDQALAVIEQAGRTCYKSEDKITEGSAGEFIQRIVRSGHESVIEHGACTVRFICDRGVSHELVRHRLAAYSQESTRYANYAKERFGSEISVVRPTFWNEDSKAFALWREAMEKCEAAYMELLRQGATPQQARAVLPNSLKTEVVMTANFREWRHVFRLRCSKAAHPQIREVMIPLLEEMSHLLPPLFGDIHEEVTGGSK